MLKLVFSCKGGINFHIRHITVKNHLTLEVSACHSLVFKQFTNNGDCNYCVRLEGVNSVATNILLHIDRLSLIESAIFFALFCFVPHRIILQNLFCLVTRYSYVKLN